MKKKQPKIICHVCNAPTIESQVLKRGKIFECIVSSEHKRFVGNTTLLNGYLMKKKKSIDFRFERNFVRTLLLD